MARFKPYKSLMWYLFIVSLVLEIMAFVIVYSQNQSVCILAHETSGQVMVFLLVFSALLIPDTAFILVIIFANDVGKEPLGVIYNLIMGLMLVGTSIYLMLSLTFCGNSAQDYFYQGTIIGIIAGGVHLINACGGHYLMPKEERYRWKRE